MKIGVDIRLLARGVQSGVEEYTLNLLPRLFGFREVEFKLFYNAFKKNKLDFPWASFQNVKIIQRSIPNRFLQFSSFLFNFPKIDKMIGGVDSFFSPHFILSPTSKKCRKIITFHDLSFEYYPEFFSFSRNLWHKLMRPKKQAQEADIIISVSESTKDDLINLYKIDPNKIKVIYPGVGDEFKKMDLAETLKTKEKYNLPEKFILYFGTIEPRKNIDGIIKAFDLLKENLKSDIKLVIAGSPGWLYKDVFRAAKESKFEKDIIFMGFIEKKDKPSLYNLASLFVYPSYFEGFGFPPLEAMACGVPTIVSNCTSLPEVAGQGALLVNPYNINELFVVMKEVLTNKSLSDDLANRGLSQAKKFNWDSCAKETLKIIS